MYAGVGFYDSRFLQWLSFSTPGMLATLRIPLFRARLGLRLRSPFLALKSGRMRLAAARLALGHIETRAL